ncbi:DUF84 family protein [Candidatus Pacearchaeota archaeon]|nr:DUF84 family protein [Candidatus Pacearchaeota archaeon]
MLIAVGSANPVEVKAVREVLPNYFDFGDLIVRGLDVSSGAPSQPRNQREIYLGAENKSRRAFEGLEGCDLGFGIASGLVTTPDEKLPRLNRTLCSIFDGKKFFQGWGCAFPINRKVSELILRENIDLDAALFRLGFTRDPHIVRTEHGYVGELTNGYFTSLDLFKSSVHMALVDYRASIKK